MGKKEGKIIRVSFTNHLQKGKKPKKDGKGDKKDPSASGVPFYRLFRFASTNDKLLLGVALIAAMFSGACFPTINILYGEMAELMVNDAKPAFYCNGTEQMFPNVTGDDGTSTLESTFTTSLLDKMATYSIYMVITGVVQLVSGYAFITIFTRVAENQVYRLRQQYLRALLRQNIGWHDTVEDRGFVSKMSENVTKVQEAISDKAGLCLYYYVTSAFHLAVSFYYGWLLTLVILATTPVVSVASVIVTNWQSSLTTKEQKAYAVSGQIAQEALSNIRTVMAFSGQQQEYERYRNGLVSALKAGRTRGIVSAFGNGFLWCLNYFSYALGFWYGTKLIFDSQANPCDPGNYGAAELLVIFFCVLTGSFNFGQAMSYMEVFNTGRGAAASIFQVIDRVPEIDSYNSNGKIKERRLTGKIEFKDVHFSYPSRNDVPILCGTNFIVNPGKTVALVGGSGCGKSTCLQLLQRFYDAAKGSVCVDDCDIREFNISWYRSQLGVVSQEPFLFNATIAENVRYGKEDATLEDIERACKLANAQTFISRLPQKYDTLVGERGTQLSGGQKQRIAIARALVRNPAILILDEATSALDTQSEAIVQQALEKASHGRTTFIVAHRLSTIRNADVIMVIQNGQVAETGTHSSLLELNGLYSQLVKAQLGTDRKVDDEAQALSAADLEPPEDQDLNVGEAIDATADDERAHMSFFRLLRLNSPEWGWLTVGLIMSILQGCTLPLYAYFFGEFMVVLSEVDAEKAQREANTYSLYFLGIGVWATVTIGFSLSCFSVSGEALTNRLRKLSFKSMLNQDLAWYDSTKNSIGGLCSRLSGDAASIQGATGNRLGTMSYSFTTIFISAGLALIMSPKLGAVMLLFGPCIFIGGYYNGILLENQQVEEKAAVEKASSLAFQAVTGIRTVASLSREKLFTEMYANTLSKPHKQAQRYSHILGLVYGVSQSLIYFAYATVLYYGSYLIREENLKYERVLIVGEALTWSMLMLGQMLAFAPSYSKARVAGGRILKLLDTKPTIDNSDAAGLQIRSSLGGVSFGHVEFSYPTRQDIQTLKGLSISIKPNSHVGICGPSGSGKSTCIQLLLRYYDPTAGQILLDEMDIGALNLNALRSQMAIVAQEPALFDRTIAENIAYGDNTRDVPMDEIIEAAKSANIHKFIASLPAGYETKVGDMGAQLSGGQKQRVAIARALIRHPKILLLDEATSALDTESEKIVQEALDNATVGRTSITIAHRLSSIQNADQILVIANGELRESGTHSELLSHNGVYSKLWNTQAKGFS